MKASLIQPVALKSALLAPSDWIRLSLRPIGAKIKNNSTLPAMPLNWGIGSRNYTILKGINMKYQYFINLDERGEFYADVRAKKTQKTVYEIHGFDMFEDGFMSDKNDLDGLLDYLISARVIYPGDTLKAGTKVLSEKSNSLV